LLCCLSVRNLAIIESVEVEFGPGLNIVTGETGAGKSILIAALKLVLGARASADLIRHGADRAEVEALFDASAVPHVLDELPAGVASEHEVLIRRVLHKNGRSRAYINGRMATTAQLQHLASQLVDICSQHAHHRLTDPTTHMDFLDRYADLMAVREQVNTAYAAAKRASEHLQDLKQQLRGRAERAAVLQLQLQELDKVNPQPGELGKLEEEHHRLSHGESLYRGVADIESALSDGEHAVCGQVADLCYDLEKLVQVDPQLAPMLASLESARAELEELANDAARYSRAVRFDPERLQELDDRISELRRLMRRHGADLDTLIARRVQLKEEHEGLDRLDLDLEDAQQANESTLRAVHEHAAQLSSQRAKVSEHLSTAITGELRQLGMGHAAVDVTVAPIANNRGLSWDGAALSPRGMDHVEILIAPNPGEPPRPLGKVASGGELSRALLAIKRVLASAGPSGLYVFDEVDTGVGGAIAEIIGTKLREVAGHHQVLCITHQPQIAGQADSHFHVQKAVTSGRTQSVIRPLDHGERVEELARMLGGVDITDVTRSAARELLTPVVS